MLRTSWQSAASLSADLEDDEVPFAERFAGLKAKLEGQFGESEKLAAAIREKLREVNVDD